MFLRPGLIVVIVGATLTSISTIVVALRFYCRHFLMRSLAITDHLMAVALVLSWGNFVINYYQDTTSRRFRPSSLRDPEKRPKIEARVRSTLIVWWAYRFSYIIALCFVKLSILFFYRSIASHRTFRRLVHATIWFVSLYSFGTMVAAMFQCQNVKDAWNTEGYFSSFDYKKGDQKGGGIVLKCFDPMPLWIFSGAANLLSDVIILLLPIPALLSLRVPLSKRLALIGIFSVGIMAIVASSVRMWVMMLWAENALNSARFGPDLLLWGQVETNAGIVSASIPFLRLLFQRNKKEERGVTQRRIENSPPKPMRSPPDGNGQKDEEWGFDEKDRENDQNWGPFITVPASLSSTSRGSTSLEPTRPRGTV